MKRGPYRKKKNQPHKFIVFRVSKREKEAIMQRFGNSTGVRSFLLKKSRGRPRTPREQRPEHMAINVSVNEKDAILQHFRSAMDLRDYLVKITMGKTMEDEKEG
jgi:hypothetical protein